MYLPSMFVLTCFGMSVCDFFKILSGQDNAEKQAQLDRALREKRTAESELEKVTEHKVLCYVATSNIYWFVLVFVSAKVCFRDHKR